MLFINFSTYEVATACSLAIEADKLICIIDGPILDESGRLIRFLTLEEADVLIRQRAMQSEIAANYVKAVDEENLHYLGCDNGHFLKEKHIPRFNNGVGFENGNGLWSGEQGFAIGGHERQSRLSGYLSELAAAAFVCRVRPILLSLLLMHIQFFFSARKLYFLQGNCPQQRTVRNHAIPLIMMKSQNHQFIYVHANVSTIFGTTRILFSTIRISACTPTTQGFSVDFISKQTQ